MTTHAVSPALELTPLAEDLPPAEVVFGHSAAMKALRAKVERVAKVNIPVLIHGESGTGKELIAKIVHHYSPWNTGPFVKVTCPAIPGTLLESELFGYEKGAFTGAYGTKKGRVETASRGTLFLDEISELEFGLQAKLLQLLQDKTFSRIGGEKDTRVEVRVVCATNRQLESEIEAGTFRQDLFHRINGMSVRVPALHERVEDIPTIAEYLLNVYNRKFNTSAPPFAASFLRRLQQYHWPGNIRELENVVRRYAILGTEGELLSELMDGAPAPMYLDIPLDGPIHLKELTQRTVRQVEETVIRTVLARNNNSRKATAEALGLSYRMLLYKLSELGIPSTRRSSGVTEAADDPTDEPEDAED